jgi:sugar phosphate isomerase/epimerase
VSATSSPGSWPIAAAMLQFPAVDPRGVVTQDAGPEVWRAALEEVAKVGFTEVDPTDSWLRVADLDTSRRSELRDILADLGLTVPAISTARRSIVDPQHGDEYLDYCHRLIDVAPEFGSEVVSFGLFRALTEEQRRVLWFWTVDGASDSPDPEVRSLAVARFQELADHAAQVGIEVSLEMYEDTYIGTIDGAISFVEDIGRDNLGLNPDLGNLVRRQGPIEPWQEMVLRLLPLSNFWHVKNYFRAEDPGTGTVFTLPAPLADGFIDYRWAVREALRAGYRGAFLVEHYGGDGLGQSARGRDYLRTLLPAERPTGDRLRP